jgi:hypothetical protein
MFSALHPANIRLGSVQYHDRYCVMSRNTLVTGAAAFLGLICVTLCCQKETPSSAPQHGKPGHLSRESRFSFVELDICRPFDTGKLAVPIDT